MSFSIATWNVNSLRVRLPQVLDWINLAKPEVFGLQETKLQDADFPIDVFQQVGYQSVFSGQKAYNGVAILSRQPLSDILTDFPTQQDHQRRILAGTIGKTRIVNLYVPNGENVTSDKYRYKLAWLEHLHDFLKEELKKYSEVIVLGDFNIAPEERDVHDPIEWQGQVLFSEPERAAFQRILGLGLQDCFRLLPQQDKCFSWWDYRLNSFKRNRGLRIDHILASPAVTSRLRSCHIDKTLRTQERPSDHAPVIADFELY